MSALRKNQTRFKDEGHASYTKFYNECKRFADIRGFGFYLSREQWIGISIKDCFYCGAKPLPKSMYCNRFGKPRRPDRTSFETVHRSWVLLNGIDRVDNSEGYTESNCVPCCRDCNMSKKDRSKESFLSHAFRIVEFQRSLK